MALVKIKRLAQVTIPPGLRKRFNLREGDYLEAEAVEDGILLKPVTVVERRRAWSQLLAVLEKVEDRRRKPRRKAREDEEEIASRVKSFRKKRNATLHSPRFIS